MKTHLAKACKLAVKNSSWWRRVGGLQERSVCFRVFRMVMADGIKDFLCLLWMLLWASGTLCLLPDGKSQDIVVFWQIQTLLYTWVFSNMRCFVFHTQT